MTAALAGADVRRRLADPALPSRLVELGFAADDVRELLAAAAVVREREADLERVGRCATTLVERVGELGPPADPGVWSACAAAPDHLGTGVLPMLALLVSAPEVAAFHARRGVPAEVSTATLSDLGQQVRVHRWTYGEFGLHTQGWLGLVWSGSLYALGRLQFALEPGPEGGWLLAIHIPARGPLTPAAVAESLAAARPFFAAHFPDRPVSDVSCTSWLLDPALAAGLPDSNLAAFQRHWALSDDAQPGDADVLFFVFHRRGTVDLDDLPTGTALQRLVLARLRDGQGWSVRTGRLIR